MGEKFTKHPLLTEGKVFRKGVEGGVTHVVGDTGFRLSGKAG